MRALSCIIIHDKARIEVYAEAIKYLFPSPMKCSLFFGGGGGGGVCVCVCVCGGGGGVFLGRNDVKPKKRPHFLRHLPIFNENSYAGNMSSMFAESPPDQVFENGDTQNFLLFVVNGFAWHD